jgi:hypothetical protein
MHFVIIVIFQQRGNGSLAGVQPTLARPHRRMTPNFRPPVALNSPAARGRPSQMQIPNSRLPPLTPRLQ